MGLKLHSKFKLSPLKSTPNAGVKQNKEPIKHKVLNTLTLLFRLNILAINPLSIKNKIPIKKLFITSIPKFGCVYNKRCYKTNKSQCQV